MVKFIYLLADAKAEVERGIQSTVLTSSGDIGTLARNLTNTLLFVVGTISVIMVIVGGLRMVLSSGNPANVKTARETVLYALIGVIVALMGYAMVNFVVARFAIV